MLVLIGSGANKFQHWLNNGFMYEFVSYLYWCFIGLSGNNDNAITLKWNNKTPIQIKNKIFLKGLITFYASNPEKS